jgi:hypothetical protein
MTKDDPTNFVEDAEAFYTILVQFVELKKGPTHNHDHQWSYKDILYVQAALDELTQARRAAFQERFKDYQIEKLLPIQCQGSA